MNNCLGCGADLSGTPANRRSLDNLNNSDVQNVIDVWKSMMRRCSSDGNSDDICKGGKMCRKCFLAYKSYWQRDAEILSKLKSLLPSRPPPHKKAKHDYSSSACADSCVSPDVSVSTFSNTN